MVFHRIPKAVKYVEDMIFHGLFSTVNKWEDLNRKRDINYYGNLGLYFLHTTIVFKSQEPNLTKDEPRCTIWLHYISKLY